MAVTKYNYEAQGILGNQTLGAIWVDGVDNDRFNELLKEGGAVDILEVVTQEAKDAGRYFEIDGEPPEVEPE